tara:strand:+ start:78 stop:1211 length:1134 start_codon:yes stop_codon:yes gene_type:complete
MKFLLIFFVIFLTHKLSFALDTIAKQAIVYDVETSSVIFEKNADEFMSPSSMSKLMTVYYIFKKLKNNEISMNDKFTVSKKAWKKGGSKMFLNENSAVSIEDLLKGIIVQSGNDACITIAEGFSGSEDNFAKELNILAKEIGLTNSNFINATGWPDIEHLMTARDVLKLSLRTIEDFPELYKLYAQKEFTYNKIKQLNRNPLLYTDSSSDGLKTGHTSLGGFGLAASSERNNRRIILVINGLNSSKTRREESKKLMNAAFFQYKNIIITQDGKPFYSLKVWNGKKNKLKINAREKIGITIPKTLSDNVKFIIKYRSPMSAPINKNDEVAKLQVQKKNGDVIKEFSLFASEDIKEVNFLSKLVFKFKYLIFGESIYSD